MYVSKYNMYIGVLVFMHTHAHFCKLTVSVAGCGSNKSQNFSNYLSKLHLKCNNNIRHKISFLIACEV